MSSTKFISERHVVETSIIHFDGNGKSTWGNGSYDEPQPNSLSFPHIDSCPYATKTCKDSCYVHGMEEKKPELLDLFAENYQVVRQILLPKYEKGSIAGVKSIANWISDNASGGFRWHNSGDIFSRSYACFIRDICIASPGVQHTIFTRSFPFITPLMEAPNLAVNISADMDNWKQANIMAKRTGARITFLTAGTLPKSFPVRDTVIFPDYHVRGSQLNKPTSSLWWNKLDLNQQKMVCPADFFGQGENRRCGPCDLCLT
tara:strand:- start:7247 stop:8026 length:780 start_codon:yes stop_codon:yes gene_type:complete